MKKAVKTVSIMAFVMTICFFFAAPANAVSISKTLNFSVVGFDYWPGLESDILPTGPAEDPVVGSVTINFDPDSGFGYLDETTGIVLNSLNIALDSQISFNYYKGGDILVIGGLAGGLSDISGVDGIELASNDFCLAFGAISSIPYISDMSYVQATDIYGFWVSETGSVSVVPEPGAAGLVTLGFIGLMWVKRRNEG
jgi:hypothetical protein